MPSLIIRGAMEPDVADLIQKLSEVTISLDKDVAELRVSVAALTAVLAAQLNPDAPEEGVKHIHLIESEARKADPTAEQRQRVSDVVDAVKLMLKHGVHKT